MAGSKSIRRAVRRAKAVAETSANARKVIDDLVAGIALAECAQRSLSEQEIGAPEQITLDRARDLLWAVHDALDSTL